MKKIQKQILKRFCAILLLSAMLAVFTVPVAHADWNVTGAEEDQYGVVGSIFNEIDQFVSGAGGEELVTFTQFHGGLEAPDAGIIDPERTGIAKFGTAREFILTVLNFALSFLGIIAIAVVIYGGFLYVTSAGSEEQTGKAKKAITYAAIGILLIIGSYALVNTLITLDPGRQSAEGDVNDPTRRPPGSDGENGRDGRDGRDGVDGNNFDNDGDGDVDGDDDDDIPTTPPEIGHNRGQRSIYQIVGNSLNGHVRDFTSAYKNLSAIDSIMKRLSAVPTPKTPADNEEYFNRAKSLVQEIRNNTNPESFTHVAARKLIDGWIAKTSNRDLSDRQTDEEAEAAPDDETGAELENESEAESGQKSKKLELDQNANGLNSINKNLKGQLGDFTAKTPKSGYGINLKQEFEKELKVAGLGIFETNEAKAGDKVIDDFENAVTEIIGPDQKEEQTPPLKIECTKADAENAEGKIGIAKKLLGDSIGTAKATPFIKKGFNKQEEIERVLSGLDPDATVSTVIEQAFNDLKKACNGLPEDPSNISLFVNSLRSMRLLTLVIRNIDFVFVQIRATQISGNAPLVVEFNGLDSKDPTGVTIEDSRYEWDPEGTQTKNSDIAETQSTGDASASARARVECNQRTGPVIVCTYTQPGTYMASLKITSSDPSRVASGIAFLPIKVQPSIARINLEARAGTYKDVLRKYKTTDDGKPYIATDKTEFQAVSSEAKTSGVIFNTAGSAAGGAAQIKEFNWSFGDGTSNEKIQDANAEVIHKYKNDGIFATNLEVTDTSGRKDKKLFRVIVAPIAARILTDRQTGEPDELFEFDGGYSKSDRGGAKPTYKWTIDRVDPEPGPVTDNKSVVEVTGGKETSILRARFKKTGVYRVSLEFGDSVSTAFDNELIEIRSRKPRANFSADFPNRLRPGLVKLDASGTFDPDKDELLYQWEIFDGQGNAVEKEVTFDIEGEGALSGGDKESKILNLVFKKVGTYTIRLTAKDKLPESLQQTDVREKKIEVASVVEARFNAQYSAAVQLDTEKSEAEINIDGTVKNAERVEIDFGDRSDIADVTLGEEETTFDEAHTYKAAGTYIVTAKAISDKGNGENVIRKRVYVTPADSPFAVIEAAIDDVPVGVDEPTGDTSEPSVTVIRRKIIKFSAAQSINSNGNRATKENLKFSWSFGDNKGSTEIAPDHSYGDTSPENEPLEVKLTVTELDNSKEHTASFFVTVESKKPEVNTLSLEKKTDGEKTPVEVQLTAEGAVDPDGRITNYQFWYFDPADRERKLSVIDTQTNYALLTVETAGAEDEEHEYLFCVSVTDNENTSTECSEMFEDSALPKLKVKNGENNPPTAAFHLDSPSNSWKVGETVTFISDSEDTKDKDNENNPGSIKEYIWDFDGDGFQNDNPTTEPTVKHTYEKKSPKNGYKVKLKVIDNLGAAGYSKEFPVFITAKSQPPVVGFSCSGDPDVPRRIKCIDSSTADEQNGAKLVKWTWDFDIKEEYNCDVPPELKPTHCNGDPDDDVDSTEQNPEFEYPTNPTFFDVKLTVEDSDANVSEMVMTVNLIPGAGGSSPTGTGPTDSQTLKAELYVMDPNCTPSLTKNCHVKELRLPGNGAAVTFFWGDSRGDITQYKLDKNIHCDTDGDGNKINDTDNPDIAVGQCIDANGNQITHCWQTFYSADDQTDSSAPGKFRVKLTTETAAGETSTDNVDIIFTGPIGEMNKGQCFRTVGSAALLARLTPQNTIFFSIIGVVILLLLGYGLSGFLLKGKKRE